MDVGTDMNDTEKKEKKSSSSSSYPPPNQPQQSSSSGRPSLLSSRVTPRTIVVRIIAILVMIISITSVVFLILNAASGGSRKNLPNKEISDICDNKGKSAAQSFKLYPAFDKAFIICTDTSVNRLLEVDIVQQQRTVKTIFSIENAATKIVDISVPSFDPDTKSLYFATSSGDIFKYTVGSQPAKTSIQPPSSNYTLLASFLVWKDADTNRSRFAVGFAKRSDIPTTDGIVSVWEESASNITKISDYDAKLKNLAPYPIQLYKPSGSSVSIVGITEANKINIIPLTLATSDSLTINQENCQNSLLSYKILSIRNNYIFGIALDQSAKSVLVSINAGTRAQLFCSESKIIGSVEGMVAGTDRSMFIAGITTSPLVYEVDFNGIIMRRFNTDESVGHIPFNAIAADGKRLFVATSGTLYIYLL
ncbi:hypothetical protein HK098_004498 [Nowakowskiella sp. JEL0407]|nr:hypothetical protein HK098_004498 [Nowakowskiella sp. JEL0407]